MISCTGYLEGVLKEIGIVFSSLTKYMKQVDEQYVMSGIETNAYPLMTILSNRSFLFSQMIRTQRDYPGKDS